MTENTPTPPNVFDTETLGVLMDAYALDTESVKKYNTPFFRNKINARAAGIKWKMTSEEVEQYKTGGSLLDWCLANDFVLHPGMEKFYRDLDNATKPTCMVFSQQWGEHRAIAAYLLWKLTYNNSWQGAIVSPSMERSKSTMRFVQELYYNLPFHMKIGVDSISSKVMEAENGSRLSCVNMTTYGTQYDTIIVRDSHYFSDKNWDKDLPMLHAKLRYGGDFIITSNVDLGPSRLKKKWGQNDSFNWHKYPFELTGVQLPKKETELHPEMYKETYQLEW